MASNRIIYSQAGNTGAMLAQAVNKQLDALAELRRIKKLMDAAQTGGDYTALAGELGGGINAAQAQDAWTIISTALGVVDVSQVAELARLDQG